MDLFTPRSTSTVVSCVPSTVVVDQSSTCTATVTDTQVAGTKSDPGGNVNFTIQTGPGSLSAASCSLDGGVNTTDGISTCSVDYTPSGVGTGTHTVKGAYQGTATHDVSDDTDNVTVNKRSTTTSVDCQEPAVVGQDRTCTVTVTDTQSAATPPDPSGTLTFSISAGPGSFTPAAGTCSLNGGVNTTDGISTCTVVYTPSAYGTGTHNIRASYRSEERRVGKECRTRDDIAHYKSKTTTTVDYQEP